MFGGKKESWKKSTFGDTVPQILGKNLGGTGKDRTGSVAPIVPYLKSNVRGVQQRKFGLMMWGEEGEPLNRATIKKN